MATNPILSIPITLISGNVTANVVAPWVFTLNIIAKDGDFAVLQKNVGNQPAGLYIYLNNRWNLVVFYELISQYIVPGGNITVYINLQNPIPVEEHNLIYKNSILTNITTLTPEENTIWAAILPENDESQYILPPATPNKLGGIKVGQGINITNDGTLNADVLTVAGRIGNITLAVADVNGAAPLDSPQFINLPTVPTANPGTDTTQAASTAFVKAAVDQAIGYTLPIADVNTLGGVKQGSTVSIDQTGVLNVNYNNSSLVKWVDPVLGDDSNPGNYQQPWKTIQYAKSVITDGTTLYLAAGTYSETIVWNGPHNITLIGVDRAQFTGLFSLVTSSRSTVEFKNIDFLMGITLIPSVTVKTTFNNCKIATPFTNNAAGYVEMNRCDVSEVVLVKGNSTLVCSGCIVGDIKVDNGNNYCIIQDCDGYIQPVTNGITVSVGTLIISNCLIKNTNNVSPVMNCGDRGTLNLSNVQVYNTDNTPAPITVSGSYSINSCIIGNNSDFTNSTPIPNNSSHVNALTAVGGLITPSYPYGIAANLTGTLVNANSVGEYLDNFVDSSVIVTADTYQVVNQIVLSPGEWDVTAFGLPGYIGQATFTNFGLYFLTIPDSVWPYTSLTPSVRVSSTAFKEAPILNMPVVKLASATQFTVQLWGMVDWTGTPQSVDVQTLIRARRI